MRMAVKEFIINRYITLKLEEGKTNIYVMGELYRQCKYLMLNIPVEGFEEFENIRSIEEAVEKMESTEGEEEQDLKYDISPEEEFFGHCSNIQAWAENSYNSQILHFNLSFYLLQEIAEFDPYAKIRLKEEVAKRLRSGNTAVVNFIQEAGLDALLPYENLLDILVHPEDLKILKEVEFSIKERFYYSNDLRRGFFMNTDYVPVNFFNLKNQHITYLGFKSPNIRVIPDAVCKFKYLEELSFFDFGKITYLPKSLEGVRLFDEKIFKFIKK